MIKRFNITVLDGHCLAAMSAHSEGSYVRYADIVHLLEEKTLEQHRAEFDKFATSHGLSVSKTDVDLHISHTVGWMWQAWKAARGVEQ